MIHEYHVKPAVFADIYRLLSGRSFCNSNTVSSELTGGNLEIQILIIDYQSADITAEHVLTGFFVVIVSIQDIHDREAIERLP